MQELILKPPSSSIFPAIRRGFFATMALPLALLAGCGSGGTPTVYSVNATPAAGTYGGPITVSLTVETPGASIYFTESNGTHTGSTLYTGPFQVASTETVEVVGDARGYNSSSPMFVSYVILRPAPTPVITPASGTYAGPLSVTITDVAKNAVLYYTTDGTDPSLSSPIYTGPITLNANATVKAMAAGPLYLPSPIAMATYTIVSKNLTYACLSGCAATPPGGGPCDGHSGILSGMGWTDLHNNLYLFGGQTTFGGVDSNNAFWFFSLATDLWTQVGGSGTKDLPGVYGTLGVTDPTNFPGARFGGYTWTDTAGIFWLFGGEGYDVNGTEGLLNDLWTYNPTTELWTWMGGSNTVSATGVYGTLGTAAASNMPGARELGTTWKDATGNFWLFGATGVDSTGTRGALNDLWEYAPTTNKWTWVSGSNTANAVPNYGMLGIPSSTTIPGGYSNASVGSVDAAGNFLLFSGTGASSTQPTTMLNTLWRFNPPSGQWTWIDGANVGLVTGSYGTFGVSSATSDPGSRRFGTGWTDSTGNLWSMGGFGIDSTGAPGWLNDMWQFNPAVGQWTWIAGSNTIDSPPNYGIPGYASPANVGGARAYSVSWTGTDGSFYFYGGYGINSLGDETYLTDLWRFTP